MQFENQKNQNFQIPKNAHSRRFSGFLKIPKSAHLPLTLILWESRKMHIYVVFRDFQKNPEKRTFTLPPSLRPIGGVRSDHY